MEQFITLLPYVLTFTVAIGGGTFALVRWLFSQEEKRREIRKIERDKIAEAKRETEEKIWARANETIDRLREEVNLLRCDNGILRKEISELQAEVHALTKLLEDNIV